MCCRLFECLSLIVICNQPQEHKYTHISLEGECKSKIHSDAAKKTYTFKPTDDGLICAYERVCVCAGFFLYILLLNEKGINSAGFYQRDYY